MFYGCIYGLRSPSGKWYIGQTTQEFSGYFIRSYKSNDNGGNRPKLRNAISKYGIDSFEVIVFVYLFSKDDLDNSEICFIDMYDAIKNGYNCRSGGGKGYTLISKVALC